MDAKGHFLIKIKACCALNLGNTFTLITEHFKRGWRDVAQNNAVLPQM